MAFLGAGDVKLLDNMKFPLRKINQNSQDKLQEALGRIGSRQTASSKASGRVRGQYASQELERAGSRASAGIEDQLAGLLAGSSFDEFQKQKDHEESLALANEIGDLNDPSLLEEILGGLGTGGRAGGQFYQLFKGMNKGGGYSKNPRLGLSSASNYGLDYPDIPDFGTPRRSSYAF